MPRYFTLISHHNPRRRDVFYQDVQRRSLKLSIGWGEVNPIGSTRARIRRNIQENYDPAGLNVTNGVYSLELFSTLALGDVVFVRGNSNIVDVCIVTGAPFYDYGNGHSGPDDYCTLAKFTPLFGNRRFVLPVREIPERYRKAFVFNDGRSRTMKEINQDLAITLLKKISEIV